MCTHEEETVVPSRQGKTRTPGTPISSTWRNPHLTHLNSSGSGDDKGTGRS